VSPQKNRKKNIKCVSEDARECERENYLPSRVSVRCRSTRLRLLPISVADCFDATARFVCVCVCVCVCEWICNQQITHTQHTLDTASVFTVNTASITRLIATSLRRCGWLFTVCGGYTPTPTSNIQKQNKTKKQNQDQERPATDL